MGITMNGSDIINIEDTETGLKMLDKLSRIKDGRRVNPLSISDNIPYPHREYYDGYNLQIGDTYFMIPPEFIYVQSDSMSQSLVTLRQENTQKLKAGYHKRTIFIDLVFNGLEQINGYKVEGPEGFYYVDGLRQLLAQFKCAPFLPIMNDFINTTYGIFTVALQSITISTLQGFPDVLTAQITLQEVNMYPYIEMPDPCFKYMIDWDLFRFYYQRMLTEDHVYKKLQSLPANKEHNKFKLSVLDTSVFNSKEATKSNFLNLICDKDIVKTDEEGNLADSNYTTWVDSETMNVHITSFQCGYSNLLTNIQLSDISSPTLQFIGGMDTIYTINLETTDYSVVQAIEQCQVTNDLMTRNNIKLRSVGFVKLESELVEFTGSLFVMIESVKSNTVPGFPGLYNIQIACISYDIAQSEREDLHGFRPFDCSKTDCKNNSFEPNHIHDEQAIEQSMEGLKTKVIQDNYAEWKIRTTMEVYPDLHLPKYNEVDDFIEKCIQFRKDKGLNELPYKKYPTNPVGLLHGCNPENDISISTSHGIAYAKDIDTTGLEYNIYVDPDFYVFYPCSYMSFQEDAKANGYDYYNYKPPKRESQTTNKKVTKACSFNNENTESVATVNLADQFVELARTFIGHTYKWGAEGEISDSKGLCFDCSGLVTYCLQSIGVMPKNGNRLTVRTIPGNSMFEEVSWSQRKRGDVLCNNALSHVVIYMGDGKIVHAANSSPYPKGGVKEGNEYFTGRCFRVKAFENTASSVVGTPIGANVPTETLAQVATNDSVSQKLWNMLKAHGLSDIAVAGILGNMQAESGLNSKNLQNTYEKKLGYTDEAYTKAVDNGSYSNFIKDSAGYGLVQFTYWSLKQELYNEAKKRNVSIGDPQLQIDIVISQIKKSGIFDKLNKASTVREASNIFLLQYERPADQSTAVQDKRAGFAQNFYDMHKGSGGGITSEYVLTYDEFESICRVVMAETKGEGGAAEKAVAQVIYDRLTHPDKIFGGLSNILSSSGQFPAPYQGELNTTVKANVKHVFCNNDKYWNNYQAWYFLTAEDTNATFKDRDANYDRLGEAGKHVFWGKESKGSTVKYTITDESGLGNASSNIFEKLFSAFHEAKDANDIERFGQPVFAKTDAMVYDESWSFWGDPDNNDAHRNNAKEHLNDGLNIFYTSFCDEYQYSGRSRLVRAFPAYLFCILDDQAQWYDGRKLWTNYYVHRSIVDISVHATNDMPVETAQITVTNSYHNLDRTQGGLSSYSISEDDSYAQWVRDFYQFSGLLIGLGPKLTDKLIKLHQVIYDHAKLREGARIHLRMGYGSDPLSLAPVMNGHISDLALGEQITMIVTSDGHELVQHVVSAKEDDTNDGLFGLFGLLEDQESSNIIANILCERENTIANYLFKETFEGSKYGMEHFGLFFNQDAMGTIVAALTGGAIAGIIAGASGGGAIGAAIGSAIPVVGTLIGAAVGTVIFALLGAGIGALAGIAADADISIKDLWNGYAEQYDLCKNIYKADYSREHYIYAKDLEIDDEQNFIFNKYNMTPWDVFQISTQQVPEYIVKPSYHQFDSRLYFGLPFWMEKYRYDYFGDKNGNRSGKVYEECKSSTQVHLLDSCVNIIDNQLKVTSKYSNTNVKVMYVRGESPVSTQTIHSDITIDFAYQKTAVLDTTLAQDAFGPDLLYEILGYNLAEEAARRVGISNLLYGWQQQYQGQIILMGSPGIKPHDYIMVYDAFSDLYGVALVREVTHSFNINTGFTTTIVPGMIGFCTDENSGLIQSCQNLLSVLNCFSHYIETRRQLRNTYEEHASVFAEYEVLKNKMENLVQNHRGLEFANAVYDVFSDGIFLGLTAGTAIYRYARYGGIIKQTKDAIKTFKNTYKLAKAGATGVKATLTAIKTGTIAAAGVPTSGLGSIAMAAIWLAADALLDEVFEWFSNRNVCCLMPLWWNGYPFVSGVKDGENILLIRYQPTEENDYDPDEDYSEL